MPPESYVDLFRRLELAEDIARSDEERDTVFAELIKPGRENGWIRACRAAVETGAENWLRECAESNHSNLPWFFKLLHKREINLRDEINPGADAELLSTRVNIAQSIADAALASLLLSRFSQNGLDDSRIELLLTSLYRATVRWQPAKSVASVSLIPDHDTVTVMRRALGNQTRPRAVLQTLQAQHPEWEVAPVADLIDNFLGLPDKQLERTTTVNIPLVRWNKTGFVARLELERRTSEVSTFYRDPLTTAFLQYDTAFKQALDSAWSYVANEFGVNGWEVRWRLTGVGPDLPTLVTGSSIGAGVGVALAGLFNEERSFSDGSTWAITGTITDEGVIGTVNGHGGSLHDDYREKLDAVAGQHLKLIVPSEDWQHVNDAASIKVLKGASTVSEASDIIATEERNDKRRQLFKKLLVAAVAIIVVLFFVATGAAGYAWKQRSIAIENGHELAKAKQDLEIKNAQLVQTNDDLSQTVAQLDVARKELQEKNVVLGHQKAFAENQRQTAEEQRGLAEIARNQEQEQRTRAEALEKVASAQRQLAVARQAELQADRALAENDPAAAQVLYAKALTLDERQDTKGRYLQARSKRFMKPSWSSSIGYTSTPVVASPDGEVLAVGKFDSSIAILDATTGQPMGNLVNAHADEIAAVAFSHHDQQLAAASVNGLITIWNYKTGEQLREVWFRKCSYALVPNTTPATKKEDDDEDDCSDDIFMAFNDAGTQLAVAGTSDQQVMVLDVKSGGTISTLGVPVVQLNKLAFTRDNKILVSGLTGSAWIVQVGSDEIGQLNHAARLLSFAVSSNGVVATAGDNLIRVWNLATNKPVFNEPLRHNLVQSVDFTPDGRLIVSGATDGTIKFWETDSGKEILNFTTGQRSLRSMVFTKDQLVIKSGNQTYQTIRGWQLAPAASAVVLGEQLGTTVDVVFSSDGSKLASLITTDEMPERVSINIWDAATQRLLKRIAIDKLVVLRMAFESEAGDFYLPPISLQFVGKGDLIALGGVGPKLHVFSVDTGLEVSLFEPASSEGISSFTTVASSPDGSSFAAADDQSRIHVIAIKSGQRLILEGHEGPLTCLKYSPDSTSLVSGGMDAILRVWDLKTGKLMKEIPGNGFPFASVDYSPDGKRIAATSTDQKIRIWDLVSGKEILSHETFERHATSISFSPDGRWLAWSSFSTSDVHLLNVGNEEEIPPLKGSRGVLMRISFSPDGKWLATAGGESEIRLWNMTEVDAVFSSTPVDLLKTAEADTALTIDQNDANSFAGTNMPVFSRSELYSTVGLFTESTFPLISTAEQRNRTTDCTPVPIVATLNPFPVTFLNPAPACHNFPMLDARILDGGSYSGNQVMRDLGRTAHIGDTIRVRVYVDNGAANNLPEEQAVARNVALTTAIESLQNSQHKIKATLTSDNANALSKSFLIQADPGSVLEVVPNSGQIRDWQNGLLKDAIQLGGNRFSIGDLAPGFETDLFLYFDLRVVAGNRSASTSAAAESRRPLEREASSVAPVRNKGRGTNCPNPPIVATLNPFRISFTENGEVCTNYPPLDIAVNDKYSTSEAEWNTPRVAKTGDELSILIYVDNGAANNLPLSQTTARNVKVRTLVDTSVGSEHKVSVSFAGDNTNTVEKVLTIKTAPNEFLEVVPGSGALFDAYNHLLQRIPVANHVLALSDIKPGFETDVFLRFVVRVKKSENGDALQANDSGPGRAPDPERSRITSDFNKGMEKVCLNRPARATLNPFPITYTSPAESCKNFPPIDVRFATETGQYSQSEEDWKDGIKAKLGDELYVLAYVDNGAANNLPLSVTMARNVQLSIAVEPSVDSLHRVAVSFAGENTNTVAAIFPIYTEPGLMLEIVPHSGEIRDWTGSNILAEKLPVRNSTFPLGDIAPGFGTDLFIRFKVRVVRQASAK